jgi:Family of unknown function (DUF6084)
MPDLEFKVLGVEPAQRGVVPLLHFKVAITNEPAEETIQSVMLQAQVQIQSPQRAYNGSEKEKLVELFGQPEQWGNTLRNKLWAHTHTIVPTFTGKTEAILAIPCSYDLNIAASKYFYALESGEVPLIFLFSGTIFYAAADGRLQVQQVSWNCEASYRTPVKIWRELMEHHYPNSAWISLEQGTFERLYAFRRSIGVGSWEQTVERLLEITKPE